MNCVNKCDFGTKCFAKVEHFVLRLIIVELAEISNSYSDFTETDIINRNSKIIDSFVNFLRVNQLLKE